MVIFPRSIAVLAFGLPCAMVALQIGRMHAAYTAGWKMEALTAAALVLGAGAAFGPCPTKFTVGGLCFGRIHGSSHRHPGPEDPL